MTEKDDMDAVVRRFREHQPSRSDDAEQILAEYRDMQRVAQEYVSTNARIISDAIERMRDAGLAATAEYNGLWAALAALVGGDEVQMRRDADALAALRLATQGE